MGKKENIRVFIYSQYISTYIEYLPEQSNQLISTNTWSEVDLQRM